MVKSCCVLGCKQRYSKESGVSFHRFPAEPELKDQWIKALARHDWQPSYHSLVCGKHFLTGRPSADPKHPDFIPNMFPHVSMYQQYRTSYAKRMLLMSESASAVTQPINLLCMQQVKPSTSQALTSDEASTSAGPAASSTEVEGAVEDQGVSQAASTQKASQTAGKRSAAATPNHKKRKNSLPRRFIPPARRSTPAAAAAAAVAVAGKELLICVPELSQAEQERGKHPELVLPEGQYLLLQRLTEQSTRLQEEMRTQLRKQQSEINLLQVQVEMLREKNAKLAKEPKHTSRDVMSEVYLVDRNRCLYYTGLPNNECFLWLLTLLENEVQKPAVKISSAKQLLVVLMKLKLEIQHIDLGYRFGVAASTICRILKVWVPVLIKNICKFLENPDKDSILKCLIEEGQPGLIEHRIWPEKVLARAVNLTNGPKPKNSEQTSSSS